MDIKPARQVIENARYSRHDPTPAEREQLSLAKQVVAADRRARAIRSNTRDRVKLVTEGLENRDWQALGFDSPTAWYADLTDWMLAPPEIRRRLAGAMRGEGYSLRGIATELDVSKDTVARDLAQVSHDETPARVTGTDGRTYPAAPPRPAGPQPSRPQVTPAPPAPAESRSVLDGVAAVKSNARWLSELAVLPAGITDAERDQIMKDMKAARTAISRFITMREMEW